MDMSFLFLIVLVVVFFGMMYFLAIRPQRKRQQEHSELIASLQRGDKVITAGGIHGEIELISDDTVVLKVEGGTTLRILKYSVMRKQEEEQI